MNAVRTTGGTCDETRVVEATLKRDVDPLWRDFRRATQRSRARKTLRLLGGIVVILVVVLLGIELVDGWARAVGFLAHG